MVLLFATSLCEASLPPEITLEQLVEGIDHLLVGHVLDVEMIDSEGNVITDPESMTGPFKENTIYLVVIVDEVLKSSLRYIPKKIRMPLDKTMHFSLGQLEMAHADVDEKVLFLLKGPEFTPPFRGTSIRDLSDKELIFEMLSDRSG